MALVRSAGTAAAPGHALARRWLRRSLQSPPPADRPTLEEEDARVNEAALRNAERLLSAYWPAKRERLWVIPEADRSLTTILLPEEY